MGQKRESILEPGRVAEPVSHSMERTFSSFYMFYLQHPTPKVRFPIWKQYSKMLASLATIMGQKPDVVTPLVYFAFTHQMWETLLLSYIVVSILYDVQLREEERMVDIQKYVTLMRIHHYIKNFLVFAPLACGGQLFDVDRLRSAFTGCIAFCMVSSAVYIINDIRDREKDRLHPIKCKRPIASDKISEKNAWTLVTVLIIVSILCNFMVYYTISSILLILYLVLNLAYSFGLKNVPLVDVSILVSGFLLRMIYGAIITKVAISNWLYLTVIALAFFFSLGKRRNELIQVDLEGHMRKTLKYYSVNFLDKNMYMCLALANVFYALWCMDDNTSLRYGGSLIFTIPIVLLITMKYSMDVEGKSDGDPVEVLLHDKVLLTLCLIFFLLMFIILYF